MDSLFASSSVKHHRPFIMYAIKINQEFHNICQELNLAGLCCGKYGNIACPQIMAKFKFSIKSTIVAFLKIIVQGLHVF